MAEISQNHSSAPSHFSSSPQPKSSSVSKNLSQDEISSNNNLKNLIKTKSTNARFEQEFDKNKQNAGGSGSDSDDLKDDIEDVNASYSDYSVSKVNQSTLNSSRSGGTNSSTGSTGKSSASSGQKRKRNKVQSQQQSRLRGGAQQAMTSSKAMFKQLFNRFTSIIQKTQNNPQNNQGVVSKKNTNKNTQNSNQTQSVPPQDENFGQLENFDDQLKKLKEMYTPQGVVTNKKAIFKIAEDDEDLPVVSKSKNSQQNANTKDSNNQQITPGKGGSSSKYDIDNPYNVTIEEEYVSSSDDENINSNSNQEKGGQISKDQLLGKDEDEIEQLTNTQQQTLQNQNQNVNQNDDEDENGYNEEVDYGDEDSDEEELEDITHCVHRLPLKGQRVNVLSFYNLILVEKEPTKVQPKKGLFSNFFKKETNKNEFLRYMTVYENRLVVMKGLPDQVRKYGSHFNTQDLEKIQMPKIWWNAQIQSSRELRDLVRIKLLNYKAVFESQNSQQQQVNQGNKKPQTPSSSKNNNGVKTIDEATQLGLVKVQFEWSQQLPFRNLIFLDNTDSASPHAKLFNLAAKTKTFLIDKQSLGILIPSLQYSLRKIRHFEIEILIS